MSKALEVSKFISETAGSEDDVIKKVVAYVKGKKLRVPNPDYRKADKFPDQWKALGSMRVYQTPKSDGGKIIAAISTTKGVYDFNADGIHLEDYESW